MVVGAWLAGWPAAAPAAEPTMPLDQVRSGMRCTALSVVRGTTISSFDVEVLDVVRGEEGARDPRILIRVSGPAVDQTGLGPGFSGSPVLCPDAAGTVRNAGAISETVGEFGGKLGLVTPIEQVLGEPVDVPASAPAAPRGARPLAGPLTISGLSEPVAGALRAAARRARRQITTAPAASRALIAPTVLTPGASMAAGVSSGDVTTGAIGTVTYVDGDRVWGFGHELDAVGRRSLLLQDAYVYTVVNNPAGTQEASTYKLAAAVNDLGTMSNDAPDAIAGRLGVLPRRFALRIVTQDLDTGRTDVSASTVADERDLGFPGGLSGLATVGPVALAQAAFEALRGSPVDQSGEMCLRVTVRERRKPLRFCNRYIGGGGPSSAGAPMVADMVEAVALLESFRLGRLTITAVDAHVRLRRALRQAYLRRVEGPRVVRRGTTVTVRAVARVVRGGVVRRAVKVRIPRALGAGEQELVLTGRPADQAGGLEDLTQVLELSLGGEGEGDDDRDDPGPRSVAALAEKIAGLHRYDGVTASWRRPGGRRHLVRRALRDPELRLSGAARLRVWVR